MGVLTSGIISIKPMRVAYDGGLEPLLELIEDNKYPYTPTAPSQGFGGLNDEPAIVGGSSEMTFRVGGPIVEDFRDGTPRRLRIRYYYDTVNKQLVRLLGQQADWKKVHSRHAFDLTVVENSGEKGTSVLVSSRDAPTIKNHVTSAVKRMFPSTSPTGVGIEIDDIPEAVISDFFIWMLYRYNEDQQLAADVSINWVGEMATRDGMRRGARFTEDAGFGRIDISTHIARGTSNFGPAKIDIRDDSLDANFSLELHFDGGFTVYRSSHYGGGEMLSSEAMGLRLSDDLWITVLPKIRAAYNTDTDWTSTGRYKMAQMALDNVRSGLNI